MIINPFELSAPICLGIITTNRCNLRCKHCINSATNDCIVELTTEKIKNIIDQCCEIGVCYIDFNGGEFFVRKDVEELLDYTLTKKINIVITTNGTLISDEWIKKYCGKISLIRVSLDSNDERIHDEFRGVTGAYKKTIETITKLVALNYRVTVLTTIRKQSLPTLYDFFDFLDNLHITAIHTTLLIPAGRGCALEKDVLTPSEHRHFLEMCAHYSSIRHPQYLKILEESPQSRLLMYEEDALFDETNSKCGAGFTEMVVLNDGFVLPCAAFITIREKYKNDSLDTTKHDINWIYHNSKLMNDVRNVHLLKGKCKKCVIKNQCGGGCRISALITGEDIHSEDSMCWY